MKQAKIAPTKEQIAAIKKAVDVLGGQANLKAAIGVSAASVSLWISGVNRVSRRNAEKIEKATSGEVKAYELSAVLLEKEQNKGVDILKDYR